MIDPLDQHTLDLVEACRKPLSDAERARRSRAKKKLEKAAGMRATLDLKARDLALLATALVEFQERWKDVGSKSMAAAELLSRIPDIDIESAFAGDSAWLPDQCLSATKAGVVMGHLAYSGFQADILGCRDLQQYRQTPVGQPDVAELVLPGDKVFTSYGSGPYVVLEVVAQSWRGLTAYSLILNSLGLELGKADAWINELVAVDGRLLKLFSNNHDEVFFQRSRVSA